MLSVSEKVRFVERAFGQGELRKGNLTVRCPVCDESKKDKRKLSIRLEDDVNHCWVCGWSASSLLPLLRRFEPSLVEEYKRLNPRCERSPREVDPDLRLAAPSLPTDFSLLAVNDDAYATRLKEHLFSRGLTVRELWRWKLGCSRERRWVDRVIVPSYDRAGDLNFFTARSAFGSRGPKYVNCDADRRNIVFDELNVDWRSELTLVEGPFDLMKCRGNATCLLGCSLAEDSVLHSRIVFHGTPVLVMLDSDKKVSALKLVERFRSYGIQARLVLLESGDPGEMTFSGVDASVASAQEPSSLDLLRMRMELVLGMSGSVL